MMREKWKLKKNRLFDTATVWDAAVQPLNEIYDYFKTSYLGLSEEEIIHRQKQYGKNEIVHERKQNALIMFCNTFINPFIGVLTALAVISLVIDVLLASPEEREWTSVIVISSMVFLSAILRFWQEWKSDKASAALSGMVKNTAFVFRQGFPAGKETDILELVPGDILHLSVGDMIPADVRIVESKDLFVSQSSLTGESDAVEKQSVLKNMDGRAESILDLHDICYMGTNVVSGSGRAVIFATGKNTYLGTIASSIGGERAQTAFDKGIANVSLLLIRFMLIMVPFVFLINGLTKNDWFEAFLFALSIAVGLTPEMLPMIVTANLSKGAVVMAKKKTIVKNLNAIQNFGAMNILCTDKTGTLTRDKVILEKYICFDGSPDREKRVLRHAYFNSYFQTGMRNLMDRAVLAHVKDLKIEGLRDNYKKIDEIPFDFVRRRMSVVVEDGTGKRQIITKGAVEEMLSICTYTDVNGKICVMTDELRNEACVVSEQMNRQGMRVLAVAQKSWVEKEHDFSVEDENGMVLIGYLAFLDPPKSSSENAIRQLHEYGVAVKVLSGDNEAVVKAICRQVGIDTAHSLTGVELEKLDDEKLKEMIGEVTVFSKLTPMQKMRIISVLQIQGNTVGFLGDGINDASALRQSDIGISVDTAVDIAKESADIILLEKDLLVLESGVIEGRKTFGNIMKYIKMTASSNFGNMFSVMAASAFLPFLPMLPIHLLVQNLLYDISMLTIPFDRVDEEYLKVPRKWDASDLSRFMIRVGPVSSIFDVITYLVMWYIFACNTPQHQTLFQSGWFVEGLLSQILIVHMIRTRKIPFIQSFASRSVLLLTIAVMGIGICIPFTTLGKAINLLPLPAGYFFGLIGILFSYCVLIQVIKQLYIRKFGRWL